MTLAELKAKLEAKRKELAEIFRAHPDVSAMPADVAKSIKPLNDEMSDLGKQVEELQAIEDIRAATMGSDPERDAHNRKAGGTPLASGAPQNREHQRQVKSFGERLAESKQYEAFRERGGKGTVVIDLDEAEADLLMNGLESKTLMTLTTLNNQPTRLPNIVTSAQVPVMVSDLMLDGETDNNTITYMEETTFTNAAAETDEGSAKPEGALAFTERTDNVRKIPVWIPMTTELLADVKGLESFVRGRLKFMVLQRRESQLLVGDGTAPNISGILDRSGIQTQAKGADPTPDAFYKAMNKVRVIGAAEPTAHVIHPNDWEPIRLLRTADGIYIWGNPSEAGPERMWGLPARITTGITEGTGLTGAFRPFAQIFRRQGITITISSEHASYFIENKVAILAEERLALAVYRPSAFAQVTGI